MLLSSAGWSMTSRQEMMTCPISGNTHAWTFGPATEGVHPADGKPYGWLMGACACGMKIMFEKSLSPEPLVDPRELA